MTEGEEQKMSAGAWLAVGLILALVGGFSAVCLWHGFDRGFDLTGGALTQTIDIEGHKASRHPVIEVDGVRYPCSSTGVAQLGQDVRYDPKDPARCRVADTVGEFDLFRLGLGFAALLLLLSMMWRLRRQAR